MTASKSLVFLCDGVEIREQEYCIVREGEVFPVEPRAFQVLIYLLRNPRRLIKKEELLHAVWGDVAVTENSLARAILKLRQILEDDARSPHYIETVSRIGYRFIGSVAIQMDPSKTEDHGLAVVGEGGNETLSLPPEPAATFGPTDTPTLVNRATSGDPHVARSTRRSAWRWMLGIGAASILILGGVFWYLTRPLPPPRITAYTQITHDGRLKSLVGTDGSRLYFGQTSPIAIAQVAISGGEIAQVPVATPGVRDLLDVSQDGSNMLIVTAQAKNADSALWISTILGGSFRRLGDALDAAFSRDGRTVAYSTREGDIFLVRSDGADTRKLSSPGAFPHSLAWSPDGGVIRFFKDKKLWEISSSGSGLHRLLPGWHESDGQCCGHWTSDGKYFLFESEDQLWALDERRGLFRKPRGEPIQLTIGPIRWGGPVPGREGGKIFAEGMTPRGELVRYDSQTKQFQPYLGGISAEFSSFSKDGRSVAYVSFPDGKLWRANRDGSKPMQLTEPPLYPVNPRWSPDGTQILFVDANSKATESYIVSSEGGKPQRILPEDDGQEADPNWSPDGRTVVYSTAPAPDPKKEGLRMLDLASGKVSPVPGSTGMWSPRWSPDGRHIAAKSYSQPSLWVFDTGTEQWRVLLKSTPNTPVDFPAWSSDSRFIYFLRIWGDRGVFRILAQGGQPEKVVDLNDLHLTGWFNFSMSLDPTDAPLLLRDIGSNDIYALTLEEK